MSGMTAVIAAAEAMAVQAEGTTCAPWLAQDALHEAGASGYAKQALHEPAERSPGPAHAGPGKLQRLWRVLWGAPATPRRHANLLRGDSVPVAHESRAAPGVHDDVARDLANSLTVIAGNIRLALNGDGMDESARARLVIASTAACRALHLACALSPGPSGPTSSNAMSAAGAGFTGG